MKKVAILTQFHGYLESYSLCQVCLTQLKMLSKFGYNARFIFRGGDQAEWRRWTNDVQEIPDYILDNDGSVKGMSERAGKSPEQLVMDTLAALEKVLVGVDVVITHDLIFQPSNGIQDKAASLFAEKHPEILWLHWIHSATSPRDLGKIGMNRYANAFVCYPNAWDVPRVARGFGYEELQVKVVPHPLDYEEFFDMHPLSVRLMEEKGLLQAGVLGVYPLRMDRGKQPEFSVRIFAQLKKLGVNSKLVIVDFQSTGGDKVVYREELKKLAVDLGMSSTDLTFMSEFDKSCILQTPKKVVRDLFLLSNVYIHPSKSETYSLTTQEARACRNQLVLNHDFPPMRSIYGAGPIYRKFSSCVDVMTGENGSTDVKYNSGVDNYCADVAKAILYYLDAQPALSGSTETRVNKNIYTVFRKHIEPLLFGLSADRG